MKSHTETITTSQDVEKYLAEVPEERKGIMSGLHTMILRLYPKAQVDMQYKMPTYHFEEGWVAIANQKNYVSLYTCGYHHIVKFKQKYPAIKTGKGCINFKVKDPLPITDLEEVVKHAIEHPKG